jgi:hypothetical protein
MIEFLTPNGASRYEGSFVDFLLDKKAGEVRDMNGWTWNASAIMAYREIHYQDVADGKLPPIR